jgi:bifunctional non-homologous end joining protein LigD
MKYKPMLSKVYKNQNIFTKDYIFEPKLDGYRALCYKNSSLRFISRNGNDLTQDFPELQTQKTSKQKRPL